MPQIYLSTTWYMCFAIPVYRMAYSLQADHVSSCTLVQGRVVAAHSATAQLSFVTGTALFLRAPRIASSSAQTSATICGQVPSRQGAHPGRPRVSKGQSMRAVLQPYRRTPP